MLVWSNDQVQLRLTLGVGPSVGEGRAVSIHFLPVSAAQQKSFNRPSAYSNSAGDGSTAGGGAAVACT